MELLTKLIEHFLASPSAWAGFIIVSLILIGIIVLLFMLVKALAPILREFGERMDAMSKSSQEQVESWKALIEENKKLREQSEQFYKGNIAALAEDMTTLRKQHDEICKLLESRDAELLELQRHIKTLEKKLDEKEQEIQAIRVEKEQEIKALKNEIQAIQKDRLKIAKERDDLEKKVEELSAQVRELSKGEKKA